MMNAYNETNRLITNYDKGFNNLVFDDIYWYENSNSQNFSSDEIKKYQYYSDSFTDGGLFLYEKEDDSYSDL